MTDAITRWSTVTVLFATIYQLFYFLELKDVSTPISVLSCSFIESSSQWNWSIPSSRSSIFIFFHFLSFNHRLHYMRIFGMFSIFVQCRSKMLKFISNHYLKRYCSQSRYSANSPVTGHSNWSGIFRISWKKNWKKRREGGRGWKWRGTTDRNWNITKDETNKRKTRWNVHVSYRWILFFCGITI